MTPEQAKLVQQSTLDVATIDEEITDLFYTRLFELAPETRSYFRGDMQQQKMKFMTAITAVIGSLESFDDIIDYVRELGRLHASRDVSNEHYAHVGAALLWTLERGLGAKWTPELAEAWAMAYARICAEMIAAGGAGASDETAAA